MRVNFTTTESGSVTDFHKHHPGGSTVIVANAGQDVTYVKIFSEARIS